MSSVRRNQGLPHAGPSCFQMALNQTYCRTQRSPFPVPASPHLWVWADLSGVHEWGGVCLGGRKADVLIFVSALTSWVYLPQANLVWPWWCCKRYPCLFLNPVGWVLISQPSSHSYFYPVSLPPSCWGDRVREQLDGYLTVSQCYHNKKMCYRNKKNINNLDEYS